MEVVALGERRQKARVLGQVRQHAQLDLGIVGGKQHVVRRGHEGAADLPPEIGANRDVLEIRRRGRQPAGDGGGLFVGGVNAPRPRVHEAQQGVGEPGPELGHLPVLQQRVDDGMAAGQLAQLGGVGGVAGLDLLGLGEPELVEQDMRQLRVGVHVEGLAGVLLDLGLEQGHALPQILVEPAEIGIVHQDAGVFHAGQHLGQGELQRPGQLPAPGLPEARLQHRGRGLDRRRLGRQPAPARRLFPVLVAGVQEVALGSAVRAAGLRPLTVRTMCRGGFQTRPRPRRRWHRLAVQRRVEVAAHDVRQRVAAAGAGVQQVRRDLEIAAHAPQPRAVA